MHMYRTSKGNNDGVSSSVSSWNYTIEYMEYLHDSELELDDNQAV